MKRVIFVIGGPLLCLVFAFTAAPALAAPSTPFNQCPAIGLDTSCAILIDIVGPGGAVNNQYNVFADGTQGPFDGTEDTLIGVVNHTSSTVNSIDIATNTDAFFFDGDGLCAGYIPGPAQCPFGPSGYEGPNTSFSNINGISSSGTVNFTGGLAAGATAYFSLEEALTPASIVTGTPEPSSILLLGSALLGLLGVRRLLGA